ncbi:DUF1156 domain-containing protein [Thermus amyloliquefaciens]|uniref:DUF1156 domain-containing protein n=1 Tax=Thermus amyloliquefaciens TaxID=1449080 RepID=UPI000571989E|nr:DUF1156 domain-containing protein [Thermus amyloliquefaciens]
MRKLIEVALPLEAINRESSREKSIRHGHPSTLHLWWARRPLASARAVLFASLVDDPGEYLPEEEARKERERLFALLERLVNWDNIKNPTEAEREGGVIWEAQYEMAKSLARALGEKPPASPKDRERIRALLEQAPPVLDPFAGGGTIPLEAQRLGLKAYAFDLNPVAVLINKALIEIPPRFAGKPPVNSDYRAKAQATDRFPRAKGLAQDVRYYGAWMREEALKRIGHLYPDLNGERVIAWLWARTVVCPNPACRAEAPLARSFWLSTKRKVYVVPEVQGGQVFFRVEEGKEPPVAGTVDRRGGRCLVCGAHIPLEHVRQEGKAGRLGARLMAIVTEGEGGRNYHAPTPEHEEVAKEAIPRWKPDTKLPSQALGFRVQNYGLTTHADLFTPRQLVALTTFADLVAEAREKAYRDALEAGLTDDGLPLAEGGVGAKAYAEAVGVYLGIGIDRLADYHASLCIWHVNRETIAHVFNRQALPMTWDYAEANPFGEATGSWEGMVEWVAKALEALPAHPQGQARQVNALEAANGVPTPPLISTDPPYYDNISYAALSDFFYVWLRKALGDTYPTLFRTLLTPKAEELVADPYRQGGKEAARRHFEEGMRQVFQNLRAKAHPHYPLSLYYAFKQQEAEVNGNGEEEDETPKVASTGWETFLQGLVDAGFQITATWPMRTELANRPRGQNSNALASSILLVCRPRPQHAPIATRQDFLRALRRELPEALRHLTQGSIPPVDLAQSAIGPGMAVYSRFQAVLEPDGRAIPVREALALINQVLDEFLAEEEAELDAPTRFAIAWYEQYGYADGPYGDAETLAKAKNVSVTAMAEGGILWAKGGKVRLLRPEEYPPDWNPAGHRSLSAWEVAHGLIKALKEQGETAATSLLARIPEALAEGARALAYRLYGLAERKGRLAEAQDFNLLAGSYSHLSVEARKTRRAVQEGLF